MFQSKDAEKIKTFFILSNILRKQYRLWEDVEKYGRVGQVTDGSVIRGHCVLNT